MSDSESFLFALNVGKSRSARTTHIRRLYDIMQLCIQRNDFPRAVRAWTILSRCKEVDWMTIWPLAVHLLGSRNPSGASNSSQIDFLRDALLHIPNHREAILKELLHRLVMSGRYKDALEELELYLPAFPFNDNPVFHLYAGLISLHMSQSTQPDDGDSDAVLLHCLVCAYDRLCDKGLSASNYIQDAQAHIERAIRLNPHDPLLQSYRQKLQGALQQSSQDNEPESDQDSECGDNRFKRSRTAV